MPLTRGKDHVKSPRGHFQDQTLLRADELDRLKKRLSSSECAAEKARRLSAESGVRSGWPMSLDCMVAEQNLLHEPSAT